MTVQATLETSPNPSKSPVKRALETADEWFIFGITRGDTELTTYTDVFERYANREISE